jgi:hypothetical protein
MRSRTWLVLIRGLSVPGPTSVWSGNLWDAPVIFLKALASSSSFSDEQFLADSGPTLQHVNIQWVASTDIITVLAASSSVRFVLQVMHHSVLSASGDAMEPVYRCCEDSCSTCWSITVRVLFDFQLPLRPVGEYSTKKGELTSSCTSPLLIQHL